MGCLLNRHTCRFRRRLASGIDAGGDFSEKAGESGFFVRSELAEDEVDVAELLADFGIVGAEAEAGEIGGFELAGDGFEAVVPSAAAAFAEADLAKIEVKIVAEDENVARREFIEAHEIGDGEAGIVVEGLGLEEDFVAGF